MDAIQSQLQAAGVEADQDTLDLLSEMEAVGHLSLGWPNSVCDRDWLTWFPNGLPDKRTTAIVSSRLGRKLDRMDSIFRVMRSALAQLDPQRQCVISAVGTTTYPYITRGCELFGIPLLNVQLARPRQSIASWARAVLRAANNGGPPSCFVSNLIRYESPEAPVRDCIEVLASDQVLVLHARADGNLSRLVRQRLNLLESPSVYLAIGDEQLVPHKLAGELMDMGAVGWFLRTTNTEMPSNTDDCPLDGCEARLTARILNQLQNQHDFLTHCTRRAAGAWPDQQDDEFLDELILGQAARDRSSLSALMRIVGMQRLLATTTSVRGDTPVVSFTAASLDELSKLRTFRAHRGRWDFEPYGISIDQKILAGLGAREVIYGGESKWTGLAESDRAFFQKVGSDERAIDWSVEQEWRVVGDIDLSAIPPDKAVVFVPSLNEARHVARVSPWPVVVVEQV